MGDKKDINKTISEILKSELSAMETIKKAFTANLIKKSEKFGEYEDRANVFIKNIEENEDLQDFKAKYSQGNNTFTKMKKIITNLEEEVFNENEREIKKELFYKDLFSDKVKFTEILNYFRYLNGEMGYITMHKTKGSSINNVLVVLDEYFWNEYKFKALYNEEAEDKIKKKILKLFYVACSRAVINLCCVRLITSEEEEELLKWYPKANKIL